MGLYTAVYNPKALKQVLLHDASEAYLGDIPRGLKSLDIMSGYVALEQRWQQAIYQYFNVKHFDDDYLKAVDCMFGDAEYLHLFHGIKSPLVESPELSYERCAENFMSLWSEVQ